MLPKLQKALGLCMGAANILRLRMAATLSISLRVYNTHHHPDHFLGNQVFDNSLIAAPQQVIDNIVAEGDGFADNMYRLVGGDLAFYNRAPTTPHADIPTWQASLSTIDSLDKELILPGHGLRDATGESLQQTGDYLDWLEASLKDAASLGLTMNEAMVLPIPQRFRSIDVVEAEYKRSVVHLYLALEDDLMPMIELK